MFRRTAHALALVEQDYGRDGDFVKKTEDDFYAVMVRREFMPAGRTLTNGGARTPLVANCVVLPIHDSMEGIFETLKEAALLQQAGCGLGFALDEMRPAMFPVVRSEGEASGPVSFLEVYNGAFGTIKQQGRHGANMAMMSVDHPDILDFVRAKEVEGTIANFNISVKMTDAFMEKLVNNSGEPWMCTWEGKPVKPRRVLRHPNRTVYGVEEVDITVGKLFDEIVEYAWHNGEPGIVFIDEVNRTNPLPGFGDILTSNPCGEQFLHPYDNCNLGSLNLAKFVRDGKIDEERLHTVTQIAVRMLDNVIDRFNFPVERLNDMARGNRRIGLGIMGFADMLYELRVPYDSEEGRATGRKVMHIVQKAAEKMSEELAAEKGAFPNFAKSVFADGSRRNAALTTVAPTGTISMISDTCSGIEPNFALSFVKQDKDADKYVYLNPYLDAALHEPGYDEERIAKIKKEVQEKGSIQHLTDLPQNLRRTFVTAMEISGEDHIRMQAAFQEGVDNSISKTINLPNAATREDVKRSFILAWQLKCKSCTVYRDGSRQVQILNVGTNQNVASVVGVPAPASDASQTVAPRKRPEVLHGATYKVKTGYGNLYVTVNDDERGKPFEVFATIGKTGGFMQEQSEAICRLIALSLRSGIDADEIIDHLKGIRGPMPAFTARGRVYSLPDAIAQILEMHVANKEEKDGGESIELGKTEPLELGAGSGETLEGFAERLGVPAGAVRSGRKNGRGNHTIADHGAMPGCPDCGEPLRMSEGCVSCPSCGYNRCA